jgi:hypothetical protein
MFRDIMEVLSYVSCCYVDRLLCFMMLWRSLFMFRDIMKAPVRPAGTRIM